LSQPPSPRPCSAETEQRQQKWPKYFARTMHWAQCKQGGKGGCDRSGSCRGRGGGLVAAVWMVRRVCGGWLATQTRNYCQLFDCHWRTDWRTQQRDFWGGAGGPGQDLLKRVGYLRRLFVANSLDIRSHVWRTTKSVYRLHWQLLDCPTGHQVANRRRWPRSGRGPWTSGAPTPDPRLRATDLLCRYSSLTQLRQI